MNILLVQPNYAWDDNFFDRLKMKLFTSPYITLQQIATITSKKHEIDILDETFHKIDFEKKYDLIGITSCTPSAPRAYEIADRYRSNGVTVVLGGNHATALPKEAKKHADAVVIGEAENTWPKLLNDFEKGKIEPFYQSKEKIRPELIPEPRRDLLKRKLMADGLLIKRGCPNRCEFCTISSLYSKGVRPIENVIKEINNISSKLIFIYDSNLTWHMEYNKYLLEELKRFNKRWQANGTLNILGTNDEFLQLTKEIGLFNWFIGFESVSQKSLNGINKKHNKVEDYGKIIRKIREYGMVIVGSFIFGFDDDTFDIFDETLNAIQEWGIEMAEFHILTPFPGTVLYNRLKKENRILTEEWDRYTYANVVYQPKNMSINELYEGTRKVAKKFYSMSNILKRTINTLENTKNLFNSYYVLQRNLKYRERYKNQFNF